MNSFASSFGLYDDNKGERLIASYNHLPVMQLVMKSKIETLKLYQDTLVGFYTPEESRKLIDEFKLNLGL